MINLKRDAIRELLALLGPFRAIAAVSIALGMAGGPAITLLLASINNALHSENGLSQGVLLLFGGFYLLALVSSIVSDIDTSYVNQRIIAKLREEFGKKALSVPIKWIERYRTRRLIPVLTHDIDTISDFSFSSTPLVITLTVTSGYLGYLACPSVPMFLPAVVAIIIDMVAQYLTRSRGLKGFYVARDSEDELQKHCIAVAPGVKELRIYRPRRYRIHTGRIDEAANNTCDLHVSSANIFIPAKTFDSMLFFVVIGLALMLQAHWPSSNPAAITDFVMALLYMKGPLEQVVTILPIVSRVQVAFQRVAELSERFSSPESYPLLSEQETPDKTVNSLELRDVRYNPPAIEGSEPFHLGPISLCIVQGDIVFIVGGSGCGKTTLIKLLLGLHHPQFDKVLLSGEPVSAETRDNYRQFFNTIFTDYYLSDDPVQGKRVSLQNATQYLRRLEIAHKVSAMDGNSSATDLSAGQRKCLALINAWLEKRPVLILDEWVANQDLASRGILYTGLLPDLKRQDKVIIVISHDDRYFEMADQLIGLSAGKAVKETKAA